MPALSMTLIKLPPAYFLSRARIKHSPPLKNELILLFSELIDWVPALSVELNRFQFNCVGLLWPVEDESSTGVELMQTSAIHFSITFAGANNLC